MQDGYFDDLPVQDIVTPCAMPHRKQACWYHRLQEDLLICGLGSDRRMRIIGNRVLIIDIIRIIQLTGRLK